MFHLVESTKFFNDQKHIEHVLTYWLDVGEKLALAGLLLHIGLLVLDILFHFQPFMVFYIFHNVMILFVVISEKFLGQ